MEEVVRELIDRAGYNNIKAFAESINLPYTTLRSMLDRGFGRSAVENVIRVCRGLGITVEQLEEMSKGEGIDEVKTVAAHHENEDWTEEELEVLQKFKEVLKSRRTTKE